MLEVDHSGARRLSQTCKLLLVAGALVPTATREEAQEARLRRRVLRVRRLSALLQRLRSAAATGLRLPPAEKQRCTAPKPVHGPTLQGTVVPGKDLPFYKHVTRFRMNRAVSRLFDSLDYLFSSREVHHLAEQSILRFYQPYLYSVFTFEEINLLTDKLLSSFRAKTVDFVSF